MRKMKVTLAALLLLFPMSQGVMGSNKDKNKNAAASDGPMETRVYTRNQCLFQPPKAKIFGALAAIFLPLLLEKALGGLGGALKKAGSEQTLRDSGRFPTYLYQLVKTKDSSKLQLHPQLVGGCIEVVRGVFDKPNQAAPATDEVSATVSMLRSASIPVRDVAAYYEAAVMLADDRTALLYQSTHFEVNRFQGSRSPKKRGVVVSLAITGVGSKEGDPVLSLSLMNLGEVSAGIVMGPDELESKKSSWLGGLSISEESLKALQSLDSLASTKDGETTLYNIMPVTVEGMFVETDDGNKALKFIGEVLDATKGDVAKTVSGEILKDRGKEAVEAAKEAATAAEKLRQEEEDAYAAYLKAKDEFCALGITTSPQDILNMDTSTLPVAQRGKAFELQRTKRAWQIKLTAMQNVGLTQGSKRDGTDACQ